MGLLGKSETDKAAALQSYYSTVEAFNDYVHTLPLDETGCYTSDDQAQELAEELNQAEQKYERTLSIWDRLRGL